MNKLEVLDLGFCETLTEKSLEVTGGLSFAGIYDSLLQLIKNPIVPDLKGYNTTAISSDKTSVVNKLENPQTGGIGYEVLSNDGQSQSRALVLFGGNTDTRGLISLSVSSLNASSK